MTYRHAFLSGLAAAGFVLAMTGCPGGDDVETGATTVNPPTTSAGTMGDTSGDASTGAPATTAPAESSDGGDTTAGATCDPPCEAGQECIGGTCFDMPGDSSSSGEPPAECGLVVQLNFPNPACGPCAEANCCPELQGCFGDETTMEMTECLQLNNCIAMNCMGAASLMEVQECVDMNCMEFGASFDTWLGYQACVGMSCAAECS